MMLLTNVSGCAGVGVLPVPAADQPLSPSALLARTCTWYSVSAVRALIAAVVPVKSCGPSVQLPLVPTR